MVKKFLLIIALTFSFSLAKEFIPMDFKIKTVNGEVIDVTGTKYGLKVKGAEGKVLLVEFWGTHCPPCLFSIPHYIELNNKYKDKVEMLAFEVQQTSVEQLKEFVKSRGINYKVFAQEENGQFGAYLGARTGWRGAIPYLIIFDTKGNVIDIKRGMVSGKYVDKVVEYLLNRDNKTNTKIDNNTKENNNTKDKNSTKTSNN